MQFGDWFWVGVAISALLLFVGHWFPWPTELHKLAAYVYGVVSIVLGYSIWQLKAGGQDGVANVAGLVIIVVISGWAVFTAYGIDWLVKMIRKAWKAERLMPNDGAKQ